MPLWRTPQSRDGPTWKLVQYNPLACMRADRVEHVCQVFADVEVVGLTETQLRAREVDIQRRGVLGLIEAGWQRSPFSNRSCGISVLLHRRFRDEHVRAVRGGPAGMLGRCLAVRVRTKSEEFTVLALYFSPRVTETKEQAPYERTVRMLFQWLSNELAGCPARSVPVILCDLNDGIGLAKASETVIVDPEVVPSAGACVEHFAGAAFRAVLQAQYMSAFSTLSDVPTFYGTGHTSIVDYVCLPTAMAQAVRVAGPLVGKGRQLQLISTATRRDHLPVLMEVVRPSFAREVLGASPAPLVRWDNGACTPTR
ncbi:unnamed protein product [Prorocentrum cordatum]|uniref:Endonuclease/exonuclease/phosphatase domain-containing protein n=1 Tax=Prorocentrum cordatum TaxID=2364126 RepID=A0ABN9WPI4_9DINO|nr:unnamed protein product [Polarella glacialis]